ncbi:serine hydrolase [Cytobacillus sp. IB215316]|uniref:serine hydrolase n=1 Tax=Cytobacillus sp. IB215316 TaxID=3097354 RepID=UPI002A10632E|nr:serine hydrolase [Cytobacillus sp. IB215316]MDX8362010.1 serine hydrolase [Cytobacillus sp. IB215316]
MTLVLKILGIAVIIFLVIIWGIRRWIYTPSTDYVLKFLEENKEKSSLYLIENGEVIGDIRSDQSMPLASTVKTIIAIEYAEQAAEGLVTSNETVQICVLEKFYVPNTDGGAHNAWLERMKELDLIQNDTVRLEEIVKGMIQFSSNANTEFLMMRLGLDQINERIKKLGLDNHEEIYPFVSSLYIPYEVKANNYGKITSKQEHQLVKETLKDLSSVEWKELANQIHKKLKSDDASIYKQKADPSTWHDSDFDRMFSERFSTSTTNNYARIMEKINSREYFSPEVQEHLHPVMEGLMENPANQQWLKHAGQKGGSTLYILTKALYATDKNGNQRALAIFFNQLNTYESIKLSSSLNEFELSVLRDSQFRDRIKSLTNNHE